MNIDLKLLESVAIDRVKLATNLPDMPDCSGAGLDVKTEIINRFPLVNWLLNTSLTGRTRSAINGVDGHCVLHKDGEGKWVIEIPRSIWTLIPEAAETPECCWQPFDFAKCAGQLPLNLLCLKDCDNIMDELIGRNLRFGESINGLASANESVNAVKERVAKLSMAFYTAMTAVQGLDNTYTNILKPFHGLMQILENPAIATIDGTNLLSAFDQAYCRLAFVGAQGFIFAVNPVMYQSILSVVTPGQNGELPLGWSRNGDTVTFHGIGFLQDRTVPVDVENGTGEIWGLASDAVGLYLATNLIPAEGYIRKSGHMEQSLEDGCGSDCTYYYNLGTALANNANKLLRIVDVPIAGACSAVIADFEGLVNPQTLIPAV